MATNVKTEGRKPSSRLLGMKFMQRSMEKEAQEQLEKERKRVVSEAEWVLDTKQTEAQKPKIQIQYQPSYLPFTMDTISGRQSFKSFNKQIEAITAEEEKKQRLEREETVEKQNQTTDKEFSQQMLTIREVSKKKSKKRKGENELNVTKKAKTAAAATFIKPE
ncbi:uncharacterized protein BX663DRAFT_514118 [Cokeromyces recurvatus]|uniref:uncharacterized protein n=1 Tax=Cokeromyces recurvatus TaxID=90255 RepID=UPI002220E224|nr:uncharacterized protein BX663DRAFT_514118 [Cokeromyces recurvatus]KAI7901327.1 hypothetical protein BX663DRAFT_514118 [Cokeromyces recurvatus]